MISDRDRDRRDHMYRDHDRDRDRERDREKADEDRSKVQESKDKEKESEAIRVRPTSKPCRVGIVVSVSASHTVGLEFASRPVYTKDHHKKWYKMPPCMARNALG